MNENKRSSFDNNKYVDDPSLHHKELGDTKQADAASIVKNVNVKRYQSFPLDVAIVLHNL